MALTYDQERQLRQLLLYFVHAFADRELTPPKIKLIKLLYLVDLESWKKRGELATGLDWIFYHYGPYAPDLEPVLDRAEGTYFERRTLERSTSRRIANSAPRSGREGAPVENEAVYLYFPLWDLPDEPIEDPFVSDVAMRIVDRWAQSDLFAFLDYVYATEPIARGERYQPLDWTVAPREGLYASRARHFRIEEETKAQIESIWQAWQQTGTDRWTPYEPDVWLFDEVWRTAVARMNADEGDTATSVRIRPLPQARDVDD